MSQRSRRFLASKESATLPTPLDHSASEAGSGISTLVQTMKSAIGEKDPVLCLSDTFDKVKNKVSKQVETLAGGTALDRTRERVTEMTAKVVAWGKQHPMRMVGAAAMLIAASGLLLTVMHGKAKKVAGVVKVARKAKSVLKARVKSTVKALIKGKGRMRRPSLAAI